MQPGELTVESLEGFSNRGLVVNQTKVFHISGYSTQDKVHLVQSGQDCADASAYVYTADVYTADVEAGHFQFTLNLPEALAGSVYRLCYAFGAETPVQTSSTVAVKSMPGFVGVLEGTAVDAEQSVNAVVLTKEKKLVFPANKAISDNDRFLLVKSQSECAAATAFQPINSEGAQLYFSVLRSAAEEVNTELFGCIKFNGEPALFLPQVAIRVKSFAGLTATAGDGAVLVLTQPKTFVVSAEGDSVIIASTSCEDESAANRLVFPVVASGERLQTTVTVGVEGIEPSTPRAWFLFYRFVHEKPAVTSILMEVDGFTSAEALTVSVGDKLKAVVKKEKQYAFATAQGARAGDRVALGCSCESLLTPMEELNASATATKPASVEALMVEEDEKALHDLWEATSFELDKLQSNPACAEQEQEGLKRRHKPAWKLTYEPRATPAEWLASASKYHVAIIREEGSNGECEVAVRAAGFEPWDVHVRDLLSGRIMLHGMEGFRGTVFLGGFSYADVLESARGWKVW
ncbi:hypothetical protein WA577_006706 [Blastocystis sp. JDR]